MKSTSKRKNAQLGKTGRLSGKRSAPATNSNQKRSNSLSVEEWAQRVERLDQYKELKYEADSLLKIGGFNGRALCGCEICRESKRLDVESVRVFEVFTGRQSFFTDEAHVALGVAIAIDAPVRIKSSVIPRVQFEALPLEMRAFDLGERRGFDKFEFKGTAVFGTLSAKEAQ